MSLDIYSFIHDYIPIPLVRDAVMKAFWEWSGRRFPAGG
jgi:hypothetical protein